MDVKEAARPMNRPTPIVPSSGQESVWDYPRPPRLEATSHHITIEFNGVTIAESRQQWRVLETSHPPVYYIAPEDVRLEFLTPESQTSVCEWKGVARYYGLTVADRVERGVAWCYPEPTMAFMPIAHHIAFYPGRVDRCLLDGEIVRAQPGQFYGGWVTDSIVGPFKGDPGSRFW